MHTQALLENPQMLMESYKYKPHLILSTNCRAEALCNCYACAPQLHNSCTSRVCEAASGHPRVQGKLFSCSLAFGRSCRIPSARSNPRKEPCNSCLSAYQLPSAFAAGASPCHAFTPPENPKLCFSVGLPSPIAAT